MLFNFNRKSEELNARIALGRLLEHKEKLLEASRIVFEELKDDEDLNYALRIIKGKIKSITYSLPTTKTEKGMGVMSLDYGIADIWFHKKENGQIALVIHIDGTFPHTVKQFDRQGNIIKEQNPEGKERL